MRVLIVEDEPKLARLIARGLGEEGHVADVAGRGRTRCGWRGRPLTTRVARVASLPQTLTDPNALPLGGHVVIVGGGTNAVYAFTPTGRPRSG
jgi:CheY-like chemotaxis protein